MIVTPIWQYKQPNIKGRIMICSFNLTDEDIRWIWNTPIDERIIAVFNEKYKIVKYPDLSIYRKLPENLVVELHLELITE